MRQNRIFLNETILEKYFEDMFIRFTDEDVVYTNVENLNQFVASNVVITPTHLYMEVKGIVPYNGKMIKKTIEATLTKGRNVIKKEDYCIILIAPDNTIQEDLTVIEPYVIFVDLNNITKHVDYVLNIEKPLEANVTNGILNLDVEPGLFVFKTIEGLKKSEEILSINGVVPVNGNINIVGYGDVTVSVK